MRLLLETHIAIWAALDPDALTAAERKRMAEADIPLVLSAVAMWELRLKWHSFHISVSRKGPVDPEAVVAFAADSFAGRRGRSSSLALSMLFTMLDGSTPPT